MKSSANRILPAFSIIILFIILMIVGIAVIPMITVKLAPTKSGNSIYVDFKYPGASSESVEQAVTAKLEGALSTVKGVKTIRSTSGIGRGSLEAALDEYADIGQVRYEIATLMRHIYRKLPSGTSYPLVRTQQSSEEANETILSYSITGNVSTYGVRDFAERTIRQRLVQVEGVSEIRITGASPMIWKLKFKQNYLDLYGVSVTDIKESISTYFKKYALGKSYSVDANNGGSAAYTYVYFRNSADSLDWSRVPVKIKEGRIIYLTDLVNIRYVEQDPGSYYRVNGLSTIQMEIVAAKNTNHILLANAIKQQIQDLRQLYQDSYSIEITHDGTQYLRDELLKVLERTLIALSILLLFIYLVGKSLRYLIFISLSLICNLLVSFLFFYIFHIEIHLYSLAGLTISIGLMIDNSIVIIDHILCKKNLRVFLAVTGATLTTVGAVCVVFFLDEQQRDKLQDFAWVVIISLGVSLAVAQLFIPALIERLPLKRTSISGILSRHRKAVIWNRFYTKILNSCIRLKVPLFIVAVLVFGVPVFMLPEKIENQSSIWGRAYNSTIGTELYNQSVRPKVDLALGGGLRLFLLNADRFSSNDGSARETNLRVSIRMPDGAGLLQMNNVVLRFERFLAGYKEIDQFRSVVNSGHDATIQINFKNEFKTGYFPYSLKQRLESEAISVGLAEFDISGVGEGFNNQINAESSNYTLKLSGYSYDNLLRLAERTGRLLEQNGRVEKVAIRSESMGSGEKNNYEFVFRVKDVEKLLLNQLSPHVVNRSLATFSSEKYNGGQVYYHQKQVPVLISREGRAADVWQVMNEPVRSDSGSYWRLKEFTRFDKQKSDNVIRRENQEYQIAVDYNFIGESFLGENIREEVITKIRANLPLGYSIDSAQSNFWYGAKKKLTWAILLTILIVFVVCTVLLNSIRQALAVIALIPFSFIGVFFTTYIFEYRFDEGGYSALVILCGIVVGAALYILNDFNNLSHDFPDRPPRLLYIKAYNSKIIPVVLSRISIIIALIPFVVATEKELFWYPFAMSVLGGLLLSMVAILIFLPLLLKGIKIQAKIPNTI